MHYAAGTHKKDCSRFLHILAGKLNTCFTAVISMVPEEGLSSILKRFIFHFNSVII